MKKGLKLLLSLATVFMVSGTVTACNVDKRTPEEKVQEAYDSLVYSGLNAVTSDIELITSVADLEDVAITYAVAADQNYLAVAEDGASIKVTRPTYEVGDVMLTPGFTATISYENVTKTKTFNVKIMKASTVITAAEYLQLTNDTGDAYSFSGEVVVEGTGAILVGDSTGLVYVYSNDAAEKADVGDFVKIEGGFTAYNAVPQFAYNAKIPCTTTKLKDSEVVDSYRYTKQDATTWDAARLDSYVNKENPTVADLQGHYITFEGILSVSGKYYNVEFPGASKAVGSIAYPSEALKTELNALDGKMISATGYTLYISGGKYVNLFTESVKEVTVDDNKKAELATNSLKVAKEVEEDFVLPATSTYDAEVTWTSNNEALAIGAKGENGYPVTVTRSEAGDVDVKLTATIKVGEATKVKEFDVKVLAIPQYVDVVETTPTPGVEYKLGFELPQGAYFFDGNLDEQGKYGNTTNLADQEVKVQVEKENDNYHLFFMDGEAKKYIVAKEVDENGSTKQRFRIVDEKETAFQWDSTFNTFTVELSGTKYCMGTYENKGNIFTTISVSKYSYLEKNPATQYPVKLYKQVLASDAPVEVDYVTSPVADKAYRLGVENASTKFYFAGEMSGHYGKADTDITKGIDVKLVSVDGGYKMTFVDANSKTQYINVVLSGTYINFTFAETATSVFAWDTTNNAFVTEIDGAKYFIGANGTYKSFGAYAAADFAKDDVFPARFYEVPQASEEPENPTPSGKITTIVDALEAADGTEVEITATVTAVTEAWNTQYNNMSVKITDEDGNTILVYRLKTQVGMNDVIKVTGKVGSHFENKQIVEATAVILEDNEYVNPTEGATASMTFEATNRTEFTTEKQVWTSNGITVTGSKGNSTSNIADYVNPARFYAKTSLKIEYTSEMTKIVIETSGDKCYSAGATLDGATLTVEGNLMIIELDTPATSFEISELVTQIRVSKLYVFTA